MAKAPSGLKSLAERIIGVGKIQGTAMLNTSEYFTKADMVQTGIPMMDVALSGSLRSGFVPGITTFGGPSRSFKTLFGLIQASAYLRKYPEANLLLYDSEFGSPLSYFASVGIDPARVIHVPIMNIEQLRTEMSLHLEEIKRDDKIIVMIDSIGMLASKKEINDALSEKEAADFTRAKTLKSLFRIITPHFKSKNINLIVINHTYSTLEMFAKTVFTGGSGSVYASDNMYIIGKQQDRETSGNKEILGYHFIINVDKSRFVKEKSKIPITVRWEGGVDHYSGLFDLALEAGFLTQTAKGQYSRVNQEDGTFEPKGITEKKMMLDIEFWEELIANDKFNTFIEDKYRIPTEPMVIISE
jgi:hypothetical protein